MRTAFLETLLEVADGDRRVQLVTGDIGFGVLEPFKERHPDRFFNAGVAEQLMTGMAAGLAMCGNMVFTYSIANFPTLRCLEQIRNDICYHDANVVVVAVGGGYAYGALGATHHATEDLAVLRSLPNMTVVAPGDPAEVRAAVRALVELGGPAYLRLGRAGEEDVHRREIEEFRLGSALVVREGTDCCLISTGGMLADVMRVADRLDDQGIQSTVLSMHTLSPIDTAAVRDRVESFPAIFTVEEHSIVGGLGSAVAEIIAESDSVTTFKRFGLQHSFSRHFGARDYLMQQNGLSVDSLVENVMKCLQ